MSLPLEPLRSTYADDPEFGELVELFAAEMPERIATIEQSVSDQAWTVLAVVAHQLKGAGGGYGFPSITDAGRVLESLAHAAESSDAADLAALRASAEALVALCRRVTAA